ncbi:MAG: PGN_0703 family putative restriction endonuclease [Sphingomicrobium sp.]
MSADDLQFLPGVAADHVIGQLRAAGGKEIESGKLASAESSAALAVNTFGWFVDRPGLLPPLPGLANVGEPTMVDVEYCARFPWSGGRHPWLDAVVETDTHLIGVESKRYEPYRDRKKVSLSAAYDRPVWGNRMAQFERMRDRLRSGEARFDYLDAAQLVKHAFGLVTDARRRRRQPRLVYLFAEPALLGRTALPPSAFDAHRRELTAFSEEVTGAEVKFAAFSYREWLAGWAPCRADVAAHALAIRAAFQP